MQAATIEQAKQGNAAAVNELLTEVLAVATRIARGRRTSRWIDADDVAQAATDHYWRKMLPTATADNFETGIALAVRKANYNANRYDQQRKRDYTRTTGLLDGDQNSTATADPSKPVENMDAIEYLRTQMPEYNRLFDAMLEGKTPKEIDATWGTHDVAGGRLKRARAKARKLYAEVCE